ncbi:MAG: ABC transporter ATP-binding protein [Actinomycetota bacterium]
MSTPVHTPVHTPADGPVGGESLLELVGASRAFGQEAPVHALRDVTLQVRAGDHLAIIGPSGSGKSTMLGLLGVLDRPTEGAVIVTGHDTSALADDERSRLRGEVIGFVFQQFHLIPYLTALGNVETALCYRGLARAERRERALAALAEVGLADRADHRPVQLSGGEQQRVAIARAIVTEPRLVLADEPTGALDTANAVLVMDIFARLAQADRALILVTHDPRIAATTNRVVSMRDGRIVSDVAQAPTPFVAEGSGVAP